MQRSEGREQMWEAKRKPELRVNKGKRAGSCELWHSAKLFCKKEIQQVLNWWWKCQQLSSLTDNRDREWARWQGEMGRKMENTIYLGYTPTNIAFQDGISNHSRLWQDGTSLADFNVFFMCFKFAVPVIIEQDHLLITKESARTTLVSPTCISVSNNKNGLCF